MDKSKKYSYFGEKESYIDTLGKGRIRNYF